MFGPETGMATMSALVRVIFGHLCGLLRWVSVWPMDLHLHVPTGWHASPFDLAILNERSPIGAVLSEPVLHPQRPFLPSNVVDRSERCPAGAGQLWPYQASISDVVLPASFPTFHALILLPVTACFSASLCLLGASFSCSVDW